MTPTEALSGLADRALQSLQGVGDPQLLAGALLVTLGGAAALVGSALQEPFPHSVHEGLFPVCQGCHTGI